MWKKISNFLNFFCVTIFCLIVLLFFYLENVIPRTAFVIGKFEYFLRAITSFIVCVCPVLILLSCSKFIKNKILTYFIYVFFCLYYLFLFFLLFYLIITENFFDIDFFINNFREAFFTISSIFSGFKVLSIVLFCLIFILSFFVTINFLILG